MKILMVIKGLHKGGKERRMLELIKGLKKNPASYDIYLVSLSDVVEFDYVYDLPIRFEIIRKKSNKDFSLIFKLNRILKEFKPDIIHSWDVTATGYLSIVNLFRRIPLINCVIADAYGGLSLLDGYYLRVKLFSPFSKVIVSNSMAGLKAYRVSKRKGECIYNGVDFRRFENLRPAEEMEINILGVRKGNRFIAAMVAAFEKRKDYHTLIEAAIKVCGSDKDIIFLLIGDGSELPVIRAKVPAEILDKQIFFLGNLSDIESVLQIIDVGLLITPCEGISNSIIEYMASGKPVIASRGGGTDELVQEGVNGFLVDQKNPSQIVEKLDRLKNDPELSVAIGKNGFKWVHEKFDIATMTDSYIKLYKKFLK